MRLVFRTPENFEAGTILELIERVLAPYNLAVYPDTTDRDLKDISGEYLTRGGLFEVVEIERLVVGTYGLWPASDNVCELRKMYLLQQYQGQGIGRLILERAMDKARKLGFSQIVLQTNRKLDVALHLYRSMGFVDYSPAFFSERCDLALRKVL